MDKPLPSLTELSAFLKYDSESGVFTWIGRRPKVRVGSVAGGKYNGYIGIRFLGKVLLAHRLAFLFSFGRWPIADVDHRDGDKTNNRISNLRECSRSQNNGNQRISVRNTSGLKGVCWNAKKRRWMAYIGVADTTKYLGSFDSAEKAHNAYYEAACRIFGEFARAA